MVSGVTMVPTWDSTLAAQRLALSSQSATLAVSEADPLAGQVLSQDPILFLEVRDDLLLITVDPAR